jgi:crotonobetainyl-CoA:carnitine CoA-transferase CaiB-like acyl-CoA transferase
VVGAEQGRLLGDQGATVYKVENAAYPDGSRQSFDGSRLSIPFAVGHRNKLGLGLNLRTEGGRQVLLDLVAKSDVVLSNFKPGTLASLGLDFDTLSQVNPRIIMVDSSAFGPSGPWSKRLGYGPLVRASAGLTSMWKHADDLAGFCDAVTVYPDHTAARFGAIATMALLIRRLCTGQGGTASVAQMEVMLGQFAESIALEASPIGKDTDALSKVGSGVYPAAGDDEWVVIDIRDDGDWQTVSALIGLTDLTDVERLASAEARSKHRDEVDQRLTDASPSALIEPANARPSPLALFSFNWNAAALALSTTLAKAPSNVSASIGFLVIACPPQVNVGPTVRASSRACGILAHVTK